MGRGGGTDDHGSPNLRGMPGGRGAPEMDLVSRTIEEAKEKLRQGRDMGIDFLQEAESELDQLLLRLQLSREAEQVVHTQSLEADRLGFSSQKFIDALAKLSYRELSRNRLIEGFNFEDALVDAYKAIGVQAWDDENKTNPGADIYIARSAPDPELVAYLERDGGDWHENLFFKKNAPQIRLPNGNGSPLPKSLAKKAMAMVAPVSVKTKSNGTSNPEEFSYVLLGKANKGEGQAKHGQGKDYAWAAGRLGRALEHCAKYETSIIGHYVPQSDGEELAVDLTIRELPHELLESRLREAHDLFSAEDPKAALSAAEVEVRKTEAGTIKVTFFNHQHQSIDGDPAPQIEFSISNSSLTVRVHADETIARSSLIQPVPASKAEAYEKCAEGNRQAEAYRQAVIAGQKPPNKNRRTWYRLR
jgi:hypothetical protein